MKKLTDTVLTFLLCTLIFILIFFSPTARQGAKDGLVMCESIIIPSLLPILMLSNLILQSSCSSVFDFLFGGITEKLFRLPRCCAAAVILGLAGGYPAGAVLTCGLLRQGAIDEATAAKVMRFNFCGGAAFIVTAVGTVCYGSAKTGALLFAVNLLSSLLPALGSALFNCGKGKAESVPLYREKPAFFEAMTGAAEAAVKSIAMMCTYIILFSSFLKLADPPQWLTPLLEITNGVCGGTLLPLDYCAFFLSFGGFCVHFQLMDFLKEMKMKYTEFFFFRLLGALLSILMMKLYLALFPHAVQTFSNLSSAPVHHFSAGGLSLSLVMIVGCAVIIFDIENRKLKMV